MAKNKTNQKVVVESTEEIKGVNSEETTVPTNVLAAASDEIIGSNMDDVTTQETGNETDGVETGIMKDRVEQEQDTIEESNGESEDHTPVILQEEAPAPHRVEAHVEDTEEEGLNEDNLNYKVMSDMNINAYQDFISEINTANPSLKLYPKKINQELALHKKVRSMRSYKAIEEELMSKRDYYKLTGKEGTNLPEATDISFLKSPQDEINLALDQVRTLIQAGFSLTNLRTGDIIKKRNVEEYISKWNKNGTDSILGRPTY